MKEIKINYKWVNNKKSFVVLFETGMLILSIFAFAFMISEPIKTVSASIDVSSMLGSGGDKSCCINSESGVNNCLEISSSECSTSCDGTCTSGSCSEVSECKLGCCFDAVEGLCDPNAQKQSCESRNGTYFGDASCNVAQCKQGCCTLGFDAQYITEDRCKKLSNNLGIPYNFELNVKDEATCIGKLSNQSENIGACLIGEEDGNGKVNCKFTTAEECNEIKGNFNINMLCSNVDLNTVCLKQNRTGCIEGLDEVYWIDSCGNRENVYSSDKDKSWNKGIVLSKEESCNSGRSNLGSSTCGNCNYELGSMCGLYRKGIDTKLKNGDYTCRDLNCHDAAGHAGTKKDRVNGESWCVYDGQIGSVGLGSIPGIGNLDLSSLGISSNFLGGLGLGSIGLLSADPVGSRHFRYVCINGEVKVEPCADYRKEICVKTDSSNSGNSSSSSGKESALCRTNMWEQCISMNGGSGCDGACLVQCVANSDCRIHPIYVDKNFKFNVCVPKYPPGFDLSGGANSTAGSIAGSLSSYLGSQSETLSTITSTASALTGSSSGSSESGQLCGMATQTCTETWIKKCPDGWECVSNCDCQERGFTIQMNNLCASMGDCGSFTNIAGVVTDQGYSISKKGKRGDKPPRITGLNMVYGIFAKPSKDQFASGGEYNSVSAIDGISYVSSLFGDGYAKIKGKVSGGLFGKEQIGMTVGGGVVGGVAGGLIGGGFMGAGIGAAVIIGIMAAMGCGKTEEVEITFTCSKWQRPYGDGGGLTGIVSDLIQKGNSSSGKGCDYCQSDPLKPCSKYRCESLGISCKLINENTGQEQCISSNSKDGPPIISPWEEALNNSNYKYTDITENGFRVRAKDGGCIEAFSEITFGVETNVLAKCRISEDLSETDEDLSETDESNDKTNSEEKVDSGYNFDSMTPSLSGEIFLLNHSFATFFESGESIISNELNPEEEANDTIENYVLDKIGNINLHVKCANVNAVTNDNDYRINFCVKPGPDRTPPVISSFIPPSGSTVKFNLTEKQIAFFVNEPSECKWDKDKLTKFENMSGKIQCITDGNLGTRLGYVCNTTLPITDNENKYYIRCKDKPLETNLSARNLGSPYEYILKKTESPLLINSILPSGNMSSGTEPVSIELEVTTSGGVENGISICEFNIANESDESLYVKFYDTGASEHKQPLQIKKGKWNFGIKCTDAAENEALGNTIIDIQIDEDYPLISRVYYSSGSLIVITNEESSCYYSYNNSLCDLTKEDLMMNSPDLFEHDISWKPDTIHYIQCMDNWENKPSKCSIIVKPNKDIIIQE
ncbi:MAG TPA: hypothetical protein P5277_02770 [Candidatus Paceibacterota bacterium]|nr:hypothetical protein [Candidatus Paceibacterota bacterium]